MSDESFRFLFLMFFLWAQLSGFSKTLNQIRYELEQIKNIMIQLGNGSNGN